MSFLTKFFGKPKTDKENLGSEKVNGEPLPESGSSGTVLREQTETTRLTQKKTGPELTGLEIADEQEWELKTLPVWKPGDVILDTYEVEDVISGGMGHVYIANHNQWNVKLAIKSPNEMMLSNKAFFARILREANSWTELGLHPNIAYCYYVRNIEDVPHIFVEYVDGGNLRQWIEEGKCIDYRTSLDLAIQFCHGMEHAHSKGMIHRDIKPENVLMTHDGILKITDFGLVGGDGSASDFPAKSVKGVPQAQGSILTSVGTLMGTEGYMAPEQAETAHTVDERADIFSFGVCLYEMFCGNKPFKFTFGPRLDAPDPIELSRDTDFPKEIASVLIQTIQWNPSDRQKSFNELKDQLQNLYKQLFNRESSFSTVEIVGLEEDSLNNRAVTHLELGHVNAARKYLRQSLEIKSDHIEANYNYALLQWRKGEISDIDVLNRLNSCTQSPLNDKNRINGLLSFVHQERMDLESVAGLDEKLRSTDFQSPNIGYERSIGIYYSGVDFTFFLPPGDRVLVAFENRIRIWEIETERQLDEIVIQPNAIVSMALSASGKYAVFGSKDGAMTLWNLNQKLCLHILNGCKAEIRKIEITPDERFIAASDASFRYCVWDIESGERVHQNFNPDFSPTFGLFPDGKTIAVLPLKQRTNWVMCNLGTGEVTRTFEGDQANIMKLTVVNQGKQVVSKDSKNVLKIWDVERGNCLSELELKALIEGAGNCPGVIMPSAKYMPYSRDGEESIAWDIETWPLSNLKDAKGSHDFKFSYDGKYAISHADGGQIKVWDLHEGKCLNTLFQHQQIRKLKFSQNGNQIITIGARSVIFWDASTGQQIKGVHFPNATALDAGSRIALIGKTSGNIEVFDMETQTSLHEFKAHDGLIKYLPNDIRDNQVVAIEIAPSEEYYITSGECGGLRVWQTGDHSLIDVLVPEGKEQKDYQHLSTRDIYIAPDSSCVIAIKWFNENLLGIWDLKNIDKSNIKDIDCWNDKVRCPAISGDLNYMAITCEHTKIELFDIRSGEKIHGFPGSTRVYDLTFSNDDKYLISAGADYRIRIWDRNTGQCIRTLDSLNAYPHSGSRSSLKVTVSPDNSHFIKGHGGHGYLKKFRLAKSNFRAPYAICAPKDFNEIRARDQKILFELNQIKELYYKGRKSEAFQNLAELWKALGHIQHTGIETQYGKLMRAGKKKLVVDIVFQDEIYGNNLGTTIFNDRLRKTFKTAVDSDFLIGGLREVITLVDLRNNRKRIFFDTHKRIEASELSPGGRYVMTMGWNQDNREPYEIRVFDGIQQALLWQKIVDRQQEMAVSGEYICLMTSNDNLEMYELKTGVLVKKIELESELKSYGLFSISPDNKYLILINNKRSTKQYLLSIFDLEKEKFIIKKDQQALQYQVESIAACPQPGRFLIKNHFAADIGVQLLDATAGKIIWKIENANVLRLSPASSNGKYFLSWGNSDMPGMPRKEKTFDLFLWDATSGHCKNKLCGNAAETKYAEILPDCRLAVSAHGSQLKIWDLEEGICVNTIEGDDGGFKTFDISANGNYLATQSDSGAIKIWRIIRDLEFPDPVEWDEGIRPYLEIFLLLRSGRWTEEDFQRLITELAEKRGYGWVRPEGIRNVLERMTQNRRS